MRVVGVDPGLTRCGVGVVDAHAGRRVALVDVRVVRSDPHADVAERLRVVHDAVAELLIQHRPDVVAVERVFAQRNVRTAMGTAQAAAVVMLAAAQADIPVALHTPSEVKAAVTGNGRADKTQVGEMVRRLLRLPVTPAPADVADALALAICHAWRPPMQLRIGASSSGRTTIGARIG